MGVTGEGWAELTARTRDVLARRSAAAARMYAGEGDYDEVLAWHADEFVWLSAAGARVGLDAARELQRQRMSALPPAAYAGLRVLREEVAGEYGFTMFATDGVPFGLDTYRVVDGRVVFQSNGIYLPPELRARRRREGKGSP